jgi:ABC-2 type transport system permease protein
VTFSRHSVVHHSPVAETVVQARRLLVRWLRQPTVLVQSLVFPTFLLVVYKWVIGKSLLDLTGSDSVYGLVPMCAVAGALFGAIGTGAAIPDERADGLLTKLWSLPVHRASALTGRLLAEAVRALIGSAALALVGVAMGLRIQTGLAQAVLFIFVPVVSVIGFATLIVAMAVRANGKNIVTGLSTLAFLLLFFNTGVVPTDVFPGWLQPIVRAQPMSPAIDLMRNMAEGGPTMVPALQTLAWTLGLLAVFGPLAVRGYRAAAESGH